MAGRRVLLVEDERKLAELVKTFLADRGFEVLLAYDGERGVEMALRERPAVVLSDVLLPRLNGWDLCRRIKSEPALAATKVVLMTAVYTKARYRAEAVEAGADEFVAKPLDLEELATRLERLCGPASSASAVSASASVAQSAKHATPVKASEDSVGSEVSTLADGVVFPYEARSMQQAHGQAATSPEQLATPDVRPASQLPVPPATPAPVRRPQPSVDEMLAELAPKPRVTPPKAGEDQVQGVAASQFDLKLAALRRRFAASLPETLAKIERAWTAAAGGSERAPWEEVAHLAHDLAGSAGSFGLPAVGEAARELEQAVRTCLAGKGPISAKQRAAIKQYLEQLSALIQLL